MKKNKALKVLLAGAASLAMIFSVSPAYADASGGIGGGQNDGGQGSSWIWVAHHNKTRGKAWEEFKKAAKQPSLESKVKASGADINICKNSQAIWWVHSQTYGVWSNSYKGYTNGPNSRVSQSIKNPASLGGSKPPSALYDNFVKWDKNENGNILNKSPGYVLVCSGAFDDDPPPPPPPPKTITTTEKRSTSSDSEYERTAPIFFNVEVKGQQLAKSSSNTTRVWAGPTAFQNQVNTYTTEFGKLYNSLSNGSTTLEPNQLKTKVEEAIAKDNKNVTNKVNLNANNKKAFAEGGVLNVYEQRGNAKISISMTTTNHQERTCTQKQKWDEKSKKYVNDGKKTCGEWKTVKTTKDKQLIKGAPTQANTGFWQMISVHCNKDDFKSLMAATGATIESSGVDAEGNYTGVATSKTYAQQPRYLDFGDFQNPNPEAAASGYLGFYDKECGFECTVDKATSSGASTTNKATTNVSNTGVDSHSGKRGAEASGYEQTDSNEGNIFTFFRNNSDNKLKVNVWYPVTKGAVDYKSNPHAALTTTVSRWDKGTPDVVVGSDGGGKFTMKTMNNKELFSNSTSPAPSQKNWDTQSFSNKTTAILSGAHNEFKVSSTWASEKDYPQALSFKWEYAPRVNTTILEQPGFTRTNTSATPQFYNGKTGVGAEPIQGKCVAQYGDTNYNTLEKVNNFYNNTGTDTSNGLDGQLNVNYKPSEAFDELVTIKFVRSTTG